MVGTDTEGQEGHRRDKGHEVFIHGDLNGVLAPKEVLCVFYCTLFKMIFFLLCVHWCFACTLLCIKVLDPLKLEL